MLKITPNKFAWLTVAFSVPNEQGEMEEAKLRVKVAFMADEAYGAALKSVSGQPNGDAMLARKILQDFSGPVDEAGAPVPFSEAARDALFANYRALPTAIVKAWVGAHHGVAQGN